MQVSVLMLCDDSLMFAKKMFQERLRQTEAEAQHTEEDKLRIGQLESKM